MHEFSVASLVVVVVGLGFVWTGQVLLTGVFFTFVNMVLTWTKYEVISCVHR